MVLQVDDLFRMRMLMAGVYIGLGVSSTYGFSIFTDHLKTKYGYSQSEVTTISTVGTCLNYFSFQAGLMFDYVGPTVVLPFAGVLGGLGFLMFGLTFDGTVKTSSVGLFSLYQGITHLGLPAMDVSAVMTLMLQFPLDRGYVVLVMKVFNGLGTAVLMAYFNGWFRAADSRRSEDNNYSGYAYFVAAQTLLCALVGACFTRLPMYYPSAWRKKRLSAEELAEREKTLDLYMSQHAPSRRLHIGFGLVIALLIFSAAQSIVTAYVQTSYAGYVAISIVALLLMASFSLMAMPFQFLGRYNPLRSTHMAGIGESGAELAGEAVNGDSEEEDDKNCTNEVVSQAPQYDGSFWAHLLTIDLWAMWLTCFAVWGTGTVMQMNATQIYRSKNYGDFDTRTVTLYVAIMSVGSAIGRISIGLFDIRLGALRNMGKTNMLTTFAIPIGPVLMAVAFLLFAVLPGSALLLPFLLASIGNGIGWAVAVIGVRMMFARDIGKHYNFMYTSGAAATIALNRFMFGEMYDAEGRKRGDSTSCNEPGCVRNQMIILMAVNVIAIVSAVLVHWRFARFTRAKLDEQRAAIPQQVCEQDVTEAGSVEHVAGGNIMQSQ
ncbi:pyruvate transporter 0 [Trypanosoma rangeli]|uniref:Pyruvate transporter 0 n=1 Tax=Trypanosoma rangeli TaxID=5698 RepID=A0A3R7N415_TRYRA|nr:pyruvate transporter 0 [Trypanosoma rangeli]RNE96082.1 pyruvate transporter 0 [Trypanosoma rangeli]|eukprot:RNE96082.1 pyruvate transporter 0 [Trypanosoma rangeli]